MSVYPQFRCYSIFSGISFGVSTRFASFYVLAKNEMNAPLPASDNSGFPEQGEVNFHFHSDVTVKA